jgi:hypothetical protein
VIDVIRQVVGKLLPIGTRTYFQSRIVFAISFIDFTSLAMGYKTKREESSSSSRMMTKEILSTRIYIGSAIHKDPTG